MAPEVKPSQDPVTLIRVLQKARDLGLDENRLLFYRQLVQDGRLGRGDQEAEDKPA